MTSRQLFPPCWLILKKGDEIRSFRKDYIYTRGLKGMVLLKETKTRKIHGIKKRAEKKRGSFGFLTKQGRYNPQKHTWNLNIPPLEKKTRQPKPP